VSVSPGQFDLPLLGNTALGFTVRVYPMILEAKVDSAADYFELYDRFHTYATNGLNPTAFGDGRLVKNRFRIVGRYRAPEKHQPRFPGRFQTQRYHFAEILAEFTAVRLGASRPFLRHEICFSRRRRAEVFREQTLALFPDGRSFLYPAQVAFGETETRRGHFAPAGPVSAGNRPERRLSHPGAGLPSSVVLYPLQAYATLYGKEVGMYPGDFGSRDIPSERNSISVSRNSGNSPIIDWTFLRDYNTH